MSTSMRPAATEAQQEQDQWVLAARWPEFSPRELRRLCFFAYRRRTDRISPPTPVSSDVDALCASLLGGGADLPPREPPKSPIAIGLPPLWLAWAEQQWARSQSAAAARNPRT